MVLAMVSPDIVYKHICTILFLSLGIVGGSHNDAFVIDDDDSLNRLVGLDTIDGVLDIDV
jgi:hypothetical protein